MPSIWTKIKSLAVWKKREWKTVSVDTKDSQRIRNYKHDSNARKNKEANQNLNFIAQNDDKELSQNAQKQLYKKEAENLHFWMVHCSWTYCAKCKMLLEQKVMPNYSKRPMFKSLKQCSCSQNRYVTPAIREIPKELKNLTMQQIYALRPFDVHLGEVKKSNNGYRQESTMFRVSWSKKKVSEQILELEPEQQRKARKAYDWLMNCAQNKYKHFVQLREHQITMGKKFNLYNYAERYGIETALWPHLYPFDNWCKTNLKGNSSSSSTKISYWHKLTSQIADYAMLYDLLQFHYNLWLWQTVSGAIASARKLNCSPNKALEAKAFSSEFWKWQHRYLLDAVEQFGTPSLFITISPYEWTFPFSLWMESLRKRSAKNPTSLATLETLHIVHILEQLVHGYMCGSNSNRWKNHALSNAKTKTEQNVQTYFYRFEFQQRGTVHLHMLVWLKELSNLKPNLIRADIPRNDLNLAYEVNKLQPSNKGSISRNEHKTEVVLDSQRKVLKLFHPKEAFEKNLRAYMSTLMPALKCRTDVQCTDGKGMLLKYAASYVTKWHDTFNGDAMYSKHVGPYEAAYRHLRSLRPLEPEMALSLTSKKFSWSKSRTKNVTVPTQQSRKPKSYEKYLKSKPEEESSSFKQWLRKYVDSKEKPMEYKQGSTLVGAKMRKLFSDDYFYQDLILNYAHRSSEQLVHPNDAELPSQIRNFAAALHLRPEFWHDDKKTEHFLNLQGHKDHYITTAISYVRSRVHFFNLWQRQIIGTLQMKNLVQSIETNALSLQQERVRKPVKDFLKQRTDHYDDVLETDHLSESEDDETEETELPSSSMATGIDWHKYILIKGKPGTGKSHAIKVVIEESLEEEYTVCCATPTGI